jgi:tetrahydromethanopterin S-methyltransferase subunit B
VTETGANWHGVRTTVASVAPSVPGMEKWPGRKRHGAGERGSASVEQAGLAALVALLLIAAIAAVAAGGDVDAGRELAGTIGRRIACGPRLPDDCHHHPLVPAYGWPLARLARALAPPPEALPGPSGLPLVPVDFRRCRRESCAVAAGPHLTASNRRTTAFTQLEDHRRDEGWVELIYWEYRPGLGWRAVRRRATAADVAAAAGVELLQSDDPALVPLETLPGRNHYDFPAAEAPPWQWHVTPRYPGWSS